MAASTINPRVAPRFSVRVGSLGVAILPLLVLLPVALMGPNTLLALYASVALAVGMALLWRPQEPPILIFIFLYQWVQASVSTFYGNLLGLPVGKIAEHSGRHENAVALIITGLIVLAVAMRATAGRARTDLAALFREMISAHPARTWVAVYVVTWLFSTTCAAIAPFSGGLSQLFLIFAEVKWAAFLLLTASAFSVHPRTKLPWTIAFVVEITLSLGGFFAGFSSVFFYTLIGIAFSGNEILKKNKAIIAIIVVAMLAFSVVWTAVKRDYRDFINAGSKEQVVLVGYGDRMFDLRDRIAGLDAAAMVDGADKLVMRLSYVEFFGVVLQRFSRGQPHSGGEIWGWGASSSFMPRLLFPNKLTVNDTDLTLKYTGINQPAWRKGTSISLGYMTEAFIDFGIYGMFVALAALGILIGSIYRWLLRQTGWRLLVGMSFVPVALMPAHLLEISIVKLIPALILSVLAGWIIFGLLAPILLRWAGVIRRRPASLHL